MYVCKQYEYVLHYLIIYLIAYMQAYNNINYMYGNALAVLQVWRMILGAYWRSIVRKDAAIMLSIEH